MVYVRHNKTSPTLEGEPMRTTRKGAVKPPTSRIDTQYTEGFKPQILTLIKITPDVSVQPENKTVAKKFTTFRGLTAMPPIQNARLCC